MNLTDEQIDAACRAFRGACADLGTISALLGFEEYPGVDALLRAITDLIVLATSSKGDQQ